MAITESELKKLIGHSAEIEKITTLSSDGKNLLTRIPKKIREHLKMEKGGKLRWIISDRKISIEVIK